MELFIRNFIDIFTANFDIPYILSVNVLTYMIIKGVDDLNGKKKIGTWTKRLITIICSIILIICYRYIGEYENIIILINSSIIAPVAWSWLFKPILKKLKMDYKSNKN